MAMTKLQKNWAAVAHNSVSITRVDSVSLNVNVTATDYAGDNDLFATAVVVMSASIEASITSSDPAAIMAIAPGSVGNFTATNKDAKGAVGGDIVYTLANAVSLGPQTGGQHAAYSNGTLSFRAFSSDGQTNPLSFTRS